MMSIDLTAGLAALLRIVAMSAEAGCGGALLLAIRRQTRVSSATTAIGQRW